MPKQEIDEVTAIKRWKLRLAQETKVQTEWYGSWGFLAAKPIDQNQLSPADYTKLDRLQAELEAFKAPKSKYCRPLLSSHEIGWRPNMELFGVNHFGLKKDLGDLQVSKKEYLLPIKKSSK